MEWADQLLPPTVSFVGGRPLIRKPFTKLEDASADLFQGSQYCISPADNADQTAVKTVVGLVELIGAKPLFLDPHEHDSYAVAMEVPAHSSFLCIRNRHVGQRILARNAPARSRDLCRILAPCI